MANRTTRLKKPQIPPLDQLYNFDDLGGRPKYGGEEMTSETSIPSFQEIMDETHSAVVAEATARDDADEALQAQIDALDTDVTDLTQALATETSNRQSADTALQTAISDEATARATAVSNEATARANADSALNTAISDEATARATAVSNEATARAEADTAEATARTNADSAETTARQNADANLQSQIDAIEAGADVRDIVGTYADLQAYDTTTLYDNDIIKVLADETQNNATTYYRWSTSTSAFTLIGAEGPYYTKSETDTALNLKADKSTTYTKTEVDTALGNKVDKVSGKQLSTEDYTAAEKTKLSGIEAGAQVNAPNTVIDASYVHTDNNYTTAEKTKLGDMALIKTIGANLALSAAGELSATDTTYTAGTGLSLTGTEFAVDTTTIQPKLTAGSNITIDANNEISATDTTYTAGSGLDLTGTTFSVDTTAIQPKLTAGSNITIDANNEISATDTTYTAGANISIDGNNEISATNTTYTAGANITIDANNEISATDTTYSDFTGTDGTAAGTSGLVPAPATTDAGKYLKADGTWAEASGGLPEIEVDASRLPDMTGSDSGTVWQSVKGGTVGGGSYYSYSNYLSLMDLTTTPGVYLVKIKNFQSLPKIGLAISTPAGPSLASAFNDNYGGQYEALYWPKPDGTDDAVFILEVVKSGNEQNNFSTLTYNVKVPGYIPGYSAYGGIMAFRVRLNTSSQVYYRAGYLPYNVGEDISNMQNTVTQLSQDLQTTNSHIVRSNYDENSSGSYAYIQNRPFYDTQISNTSSVTFEVASNDDWWNPSVGTYSGQWKSRDDFPGTANGLASGSQVQVTITQGSNSSALTGTLRIYEDEMMGERQIYVEIINSRSTVYCSYNSEQYPGVRLTAADMGTLDASQTIDSVTLASTNGTLKQLDSKFIKIDNSTIKLNGNDQLYADVQGGPTVVQTTGQSTTSVMSQKATSDALAQAGVQSNWSTNDDTSKAYIQNRPFYEIPAGGGTNVYEQLHGNGGIGFNTDEWIPVAWVFQNNSPTARDSILKLNQATAGDSVTITLCDMGSSMTYDITGTVQRQAWQDEMMGDSGVNYAIADATDWSFDNLGFDSEPGIWISNFQKGSTTFVLVEKCDTTEGYWYSYGLMLDKTLYQQLADAGWDLALGIGVAYRIGGSQAVVHQMDSKFIKVDNSTIKVNGNDQLYADVQGGIPTNATFWGQSYDGTSNRVSGLLTMGPAASNGEIWRSWASNGTNPHGGYSAYHQTSGFDGLKIRLDGGIASSPTHSNIFQFGGTTGGQTVPNRSYITLGMSSNKITDVADPTSAQDAATKNYVDTTTPTITMTSTDPGEGVALAANSFIGVYSA